MMPSRKINRDVTHHHRRARRSHNRAGALPAADPQWEARATKRVLIGGLLIAIVLILIKLQPPRKPHPRGIVLHHTATAGKVGGNLVTVSVIDAWHARRGFSKEYDGVIYHIGYHYVIRSDGVIEPGRPEGCRGAHATKGNDCIGICLVGNFTKEAVGKMEPSKPTREQMQALRKLIEELVDRYHFGPENIHTHRQVDGDTRCPGERFPVNQVKAWVKEMEEKRH